ncbi:Succinate dehydrogenase assembly factor 4, mitochondrial [Hondaea fermentalgiana]|uniref:Succinate dehydrogenase assembly factor 4, mitochondrial n=1 Tax=Hondaea fermentalgiana TaxID=2315210 RepID=A0A2R5GGA0_9STRA|nr:Succinate dehydrogenase assembly factor 4, mitochondrial [Hondaea fermentalgiana]|eukprot:GBG29900.1 Succinate dehydrogenase assembly factor 4, mitochondrial [Hondaea fermentalgiana]
MLSAGRAWAARGGSRGLHGSAVLLEEKKRSIFEKFSRFARVGKSDAALDEILDTDKDAEAAGKPAKAQNASPGVEEDDDDFVDMFNPDTGEWNGPRTGEPTRYGDWAQKGRCTDFS